MWIFVWHWRIFLEISPYCNGAGKKPGKRHWQWSRVWIHTAQERTNHSTAEALNTLALLSAITIKVWLFWLLIIWTILNVSDINFSHCYLVLRAFYPFFEPKMCISIPAKLTNGGSKMDPLRIRPLKESLRLFRDYQTNGKTRSQKKPDLDHYTMCGKTLPSLCHFLPSSWPSIERQFLWQPQP